MPPAPSIVRTAVIPAAGLGTRFLPATKATPKEMLPVVDTPAIQYVVEEAARAGLRDVLLISSRSKRGVEDHFDAAPELEAALEAKGDDSKLSAVRGATDLATVHSVRQGEARGLGHAVLCAADHVGSDPFAVLLGDDLIDPRDPLLTDLLAVRDRFGGSVIALMEVPEESVGLYGCAAVEPADGPAGVESVRVRDLVEKPEPGTAPSNLAIVGRYVLDAAIFDVLRSTPPGRGGEIQLTDALKTLAHLPDGDPQGPVHAVVFRGRRYDTGDRLDYLKTVVRLACERPDLGPDLLAWIRENIDRLGSQERW